MDIKWDEDVGDWWIPSETNMQEQSKSWFPLLLLSGCRADNRMTDQRTGNEELH